jgi:hypothetical protein
LLPVAHPAHLTAKYLCRITFLNPGMIYWRAKLMSRLILGDFPRCGTRRFSRRR